jgi:uncharacterized protein (TIGR00661 family)
MKILYAIQGTGNGHLARAMEILPVVHKYGEVDVLISGNQSSLVFPYNINYQLHGLNFCFGVSGNVDIAKSLFNLKFGRLIRDYITFPIRSYDLVINDFEPLTAWLCKQKGVKCIGLSHQAAFLSDKSPRPQTKDTLGEWILKNYAPTDNFVGFHFEEYDDSITTPIIRSAIRNQTTKTEDYCNVYLPAYSDELIVYTLRKLKQTKWKVFSRHTKFKHSISNVELNPIDNDTWIDALLHSNGALMGSGFEGPSECLYLGKKLLTIPMSNQYEQLCNAKALELMGVATLDTLTNSDTAIKDWLYHATPIKKEYPDNVEILIKTLF